MSFIGNTPTTQSFISGTETFNGTGAQTAYTLTRSVASVNDIQITINNVVQQPNVAYTVLGNVITFTSAPSAGTGNIYVRYLSTSTQTITPSQGTVQYSSLNADNQSKLGISFKNRIINGAMVIDQRNAGASVTPNNSYTLDRWAVSNSQTSKLTVQQNAGAVTPPVGFTNYLGVTSSSAYSVLTGDYFGTYQVIEGFNVADLGWGTANAKTVTLSFWVRSSLTGTFGGSIRNGSANRSYPFTYTISSAGTWEQKTITIAGDTTGTWATNNTNGMSISFGLGVGSTFSGTAGAWAAGNYLSATGATSVVGTSGATFYITGVQLEVGTQATTFDYRSYGTELALCQRYYWQQGGRQYSRFGGGLALGRAANIATTMISMPVPMRAYPTITLSGGSTSIGSGTVSSISTDSTEFSNPETASPLLVRAIVSGGLSAGTGYEWESVSGAAARLTFSAEL